MLEDPKRGPEVIEKTMGLLWNVVNNTISATPNYNLFGSARGKQLGTPLVEMSTEEVMSHEISRLTLLRLSAQTYDKFYYILGPLMVACKILASHACELATLGDMEVDLRERDYDFVRLCQAFILCMRNAGEIIPFERCWIPQGYKLMGFVTSIEGAKCGYGGQ